MFLYTEKSLTAEFLGTALHRSGQSKRFYSDSSFFLKGNSPSIHVVESITNRWQLWPTHLARRFKVNP